MQRKLKHVVTIKRPKMVKGHYLQWSPHHKIFSAFKSERIQCQGWNFFWFLANDLVVLFFFWWIVWFELAIIENFALWFCQSECQHILNRVISMAQSRLFCFLRFLLTDNRNLPINNIKTWSQRFLSLKIKKTIQDN